jgi:diamine N-acetyltransferase
MVAKHVSLRALTPENWDACIALRVREDQQELVDSNVYCIAECVVQPHLRPAAIYAGEVMVGLVVSGMVTGDRGLIHHLMIDGRHQGHGYGEATLRETIRALREQHDCRVVELSYWPGNPAVRLYERLGFVPTGEVRDGEPMMELRI